MSTLKIQKLEREIKKLQSKVEDLNLTIALQAQQNDANLTRINKHWAEKFDMVVGMFQVQTKIAGTITELRKWFSEWTHDVNSIDAEDENAGQHMDEIIEKHGFEFKITPMQVGYKEILGLHKKH